METRIKPDQHRLVSQLARIVGAGILLVFLLSATLYNNALYTLFGAFWRKLFTLIGLTPSSPSLLRQDSAIGQVMHQSHNVLAILAYGALYIFLCIALLFVLLPYAYQRRLVLLSYGLAFGIFLLLLLVGSLGIPAIVLLNTRLIHFIVSPLPIIVLAPLLKWYLPKPVSSYPVFGSSTESK